MERSKKTLMHLIAGILIIGVVASIIGALVTEHPLSYVCGELFGSVVACGLAVHMYKSLDVQLDLDQKGATSKARNAIFLRSLIMLAAMVAGAYFYQYIHPVGVFLGLMGLKLSAYAQSAIMMIQERGG